jgi:hypothetical protein
MGMGRSLMGLMTFQRIVARRTSIAFNPKDTAIEYPGHLIHQSPFLPPPQPQALTTKAQYARRNVQSLLAMVGSSFTAFRQLLYWFNPFFQIQVLLFPRQLLTRCGGRILELTFRQRLFYRLLKPFPRRKRMRRRQTNRRENRL